MEIQGINNWNLLEDPGAVKSEGLRKVKDAIPELTDREIKVDTATFSKEGMAALREQVKSLPGYQEIDVREIAKMREILPKLKVNPSDDLLWEMRDSMQTSLDSIKQSKGSYDLDDLISIRMNAYEKQYEALQKSHADGSRDIYVSDGMDENGKLQYHQVTLEEDLGYLNEAFDRIADDLEFSATSQEIQWKIDESFGGKSALPVSLPKGYAPKLSGMLKDAAAEYGQKREQGTSVSAVGLAIKRLNADSTFAYAMRTLFSKIKPMLSI
jgi:hypothetical protein